MGPLSAGETETQSSPTVKSSVSINASPGTRRLNPGWGSLCRVQVPLFCTFEEETQSLPSKGTDTSLEVARLPLSGKNPSCTLRDLSCLSFASQPGCCQAHLSVELQCSEMSYLWLHCGRVPSFSPHCLQTSHEFSAHLAQGHPRHVSDPISQT